MSLIGLHSCMSLISPLGLVGEISRLMDNPKESLSNLQQRLLKYYVMIYLCD